MVPLEPATFAATETSLTDKPRAARQSHSLPSQSPPLSIGASTTFFVRSAAVAWVCAEYASFKSWWQLLGSLREPDGPVQGKKIYRISQQRISCSSQERI